MKLRREASKSLGHVVPCFCWLVELKISVLMMSLSVYKIVTHHRDDADHRHVVVKFMLTHHRQVFLRVKFGLCCRLNDESLDVSRRTVFKYVWVLACVWWVEADILVTWKKISYKSLNAWLNADSGSESVDQCIIGDALRWLSLLVLLLLSGDASGMVHFER